MTPQEFAAKIKAKYPQYSGIDDETLSRKIVQKHPEYASQVQFEQPTAMSQAFKKAWNALAVPEQMSRQGLTELSNLIPSGEQVGTGPLGTMANAAKAGTEAVAQVAPSMISRGALLTSGGLGALKAAAPAIKAVGGAIGKGAESLSGLEYKTPGVLAEAFKDPTLIFGKGKKAVGEAYQAAKAATEEMRPIFSQATSHKDVIDAGLKYAKVGTLNPAEALASRQSLDAMRKTIPKASFENLRKIFDKIAKPIFEDPDSQFARAIRSEALRLIAPQNKLGGASTAKIAMGTFLPKMLGVSSPVVQGATASGLGTAAKGAAALQKNPQVVAGLSAIADNLPKQIPPSLKRFLTKKVNQMPGGPNAGDNLGGP